MAPALLGSCGTVSLGPCAVPANEAASAAALIETLSNDIFRSERITGISPRDYVKANPSCCSVERGETTLLDRVMWEKASLPQFDARVAIAFRRGATTIIAERFGRGDSCGRIPDDFGSTVIADGPGAAQSCAISARERANASAPLICPMPPPDVAEAVPLDLARRLRLAKVEAEAASRRQAAGARSSDDVLSKRR